MVGSDEFLLFGVKLPIFRGEMAVSFREGNTFLKDPRFFASKIAISMPAFDGETSPDWENSHAGFDKTTKVTSQNGTLQGTNRQSKGKICKIITKISL